VQSAGVRRIRRRSRIVGTASFVCRRELSEITNDNRGMARATAASRRRAEALTWLIGLGARQPGNAIRALADAWLRNRRGHSGRASRLLIARPCVRPIPRSWRCVTAMPDRRISWARRPFGVRDTSPSRICFILGRQLLRLAIPGQQYTRKIRSDILVFESHRHARAV